MKKFLLSIALVFVGAGFLSAQTQCIVWFEGPGAQPLGQTHQGCAPCGTPVTYTLKYVGNCSASCLNLFTMQQNGSLHIDNAASYTILNVRTISITWNCNEDLSGVIYACGSDMATAVNLCAPACQGSFQYCLRVSCDTLCVTLANSPNPVVVSSPDNTANIFCFSSPIVSVSQAPCNLNNERGDSDDSQKASDGSAENYLPFATPNPTSDVLTLKIPSHMKGMNSIRVVSLDGRWMYSNNTEDEVHVLKTSDWATGIYQVLIWNGTNEVHQKVSILR